MVNVGTREKPSYLPVEACQVMPGQPAGTKLTPNQTRNMLEFAVRDPEQNAQSIVKKGTQVLALGSSKNPTLVSVSPMTYPGLVPLTRSRRHSESTSSRS